MSEPGSFRKAFPRDSRAILLLAGPLVVNNLVLAGMMLANTIVAGRLGPEPLEALPSAAATTRCSGCSDSAC